MKCPQEHSGDLNEAVNAYFNEGDRSNRINQNPIPDNHDDMMDLDEPFGPSFSRPMGNPFDILDPSFVDRAAAGLFGRGPQVTHPREVRQIPIEVKDSQTGSSGQGPVIEDVTGRESSYGPEVHGTVVIDDDDDNLPSAHAPNIPRNTPDTYYFPPSAPPLVNVSDYNNDIEEEMIRAAIEASRRDVEGLTNGSNDGGPENAPHVRDDDLAEAVSLSLEVYLAALQADREKELKAVEEAELRRLEEAAAREAAIEKQKQENEDKLRKQLEEEELESMLAAKRESLPKEPLPNAEGAVTVVVRMPDGSRQGRRFLRSDQLQVLFDFIDISRTFKPGTYRLVRSYPRRAFTEEECQMSLNDVGFTSKQEALFLEQISG
uniref:Uncharacterized protein n=1 Tax=Avena sativa TaxID=4498 RepID=A0ACD6AIN7_AVESA